MNMSHARRKTRHSGMQNPSCDAILSFRLREECEAWHVCKCVCVCVWHGMYVSVSVCDAWHVCECQRV